MNWLPLIFRNSAVVTRQFSIFLGAVMVSFALLPQDALANPKQDIQFTQKYFSEWNKIHYRFPKGWVVWEEGMTDWLAPTEDKLFWNFGYDDQVDPYYAVSAIFPYLTLEDLKAKRVRSLEDIAVSTLHALKVASNATAVGDPEYFSLNGNAAVAFTTTMDGTHSHYQVIVKIAGDEMATVAGNGPHNQLNFIRTVVKGVAGTISSATK